MKGQQFVKVFPSNLPINGGMQSICQSFTHQIKPSCVHLIRQSFPLKFCQNMLLSQNLIPCSLTFYSFNPYLLFKF